MPQQDYPSELNESIQGLSEVIFAEQDVAATLQRISELAVHAVEGAELCSVSSVSAGRISTVGATDDVCRRLDELQYETEEGPCLSSIEEQAMFQIPDLGQDETWPVFSKRASAETPVRSMLSFVLEVHEGALGALNLMSSRADSFDEEDISVGALFAVFAGIALRNAVDSENASLTKADLERGLETRKLIGQATGLLMAQEGLTSEEAFQRMVKVSQNANLKVREIAARFIENWEDKAGRASS